MGVGKKRDQLGSIQHTTCLKGKKSAVMTLQHWSASKLLNNIYISQSSIQLPNE